MNMIEVKSSNIRRIGHDEATNTLRVEFAGGGQYTYSGVSLAEFEALRTAESVGRHFMSTFKAQPDKYPYTKIEPKGDRE